MLYTILHDRQVMIWYRTYWWHKWYAFYHPAVCWDSRVVKGKSFMTKLCHQNCSLGGSEFQPSIHCSRQIQFHRLHQNIVMSSIKPGTPDFSFDDENDMLCTTLLFAQIAVWCRMQSGKAYHFSNIIHDYMPNSYHLCHHIFIYGYIMRVHHNCPNLASLSQ